MKRRSRLRVALITLALAVGVAVPVQMVRAAPYVVQPGDTLSGIAARLGVPVADLAAANAIGDPNLIVSGWLLVVPAGGNGGGASTEYVVKRGDTLDAIASKLGVGTAALAEANGIPNPDHIQAGTILSVPGLSAAGLGASGPRRYTVQEGDNLSDIAGRMGTTAAAMAEANSLSDPDLIVPGQVLSVPGPGRWECPVPGARFTNDYGYVRADGGFHAGVDLFAPRGTPVLAPTAGTVAQFPNPSGGRAVHLRASDGTRYYFAHLDSYGATGWVEAGTVIGAVGNSGDAAATSPHLHMEAHPGGGDTTNPFPTLVRACL